MALSIGPVRPHPARLELADGAVQTALRLQPDAGEAHLALAIYYYYGFLDYGGPAANWPSPDARYRTTPRYSNTPG